MASRPVHNKLFHPIIYNWIKLTYCIYGTQIVFSKSSNFNTISCTRTSCSGDTGFSPLPMPLRIRCGVFYSCFSHGILFQTHFLLHHFLCWPTDHWFTCFVLFLTCLACFLSASSLERSWGTCVTFSVVPFSENVFLPPVIASCDVFFRTSAVWWSLLVNGTRMSVTSSLAGFTTAVWRMFFHMKAENPKR